MLYPNSTTSPGESGVVHALGQTWYFTQGAVRALRLYGVTSELSLKAVVIELTTFDGLEPGIHEVKFSNVPLRLYVDASQVVVEDPDHPND
ncbi:MAG TPA: hypothetical protein VJ768_01960 [Anaerolineales bacterium]|nr:hypothetical protein [Anaerolineales bacterium]